MQRIKAALLSMALIFGAAAQAPTPTPDEGLRQAMEELQKEINATKAEIEALRKKQQVEHTEQSKYERKHPAKPRIRDRRNSPPVKVVVRPVLPVMITPSHRVIDLAIKDAGQKLRQSELIMGEVKVLKEIPAPPSLEARKAMLEIILERNALREKIRKNNNKRRCRWLHLGCIR